MNENSERRRQFALEGAIVSKGKGYGTDAQNIVKDAEAFERFLRGVMTPEEWQDRKKQERARQISLGYTDAHDAEHGVLHLLEQADEQLRQGKIIAGATLIQQAQAVYAEELDDINA